MKFILSIICGIDMIFAVLFYIIFSGLAGIGWDPKLLFLSIVFAHLPDGSMVLYPFIKKWVIKTFGIPSHRPLTHHPLLMIPTVAAICYFWLAPWLGYSPIMLSVLATLCLLVHFIHDSIEAQGLHWLSPFSWGRIRIEWLKIVRVPREVWYKIHWEKNKTYEHDGTKSEVMKRADPLPDEQKIVAIFTGMALAAYILCSMKYPNQAINNTLVAIGLSTLFGFSAYTSFRIQERA